MNRLFARAPWVLWAVEMLLLAGTALLSAANGSLTAEGWFVPLFIGMVLGYGTVGALVASRIPRNPIGWLMLMVAAGFIIGGFSEEYVEYAAATDPGSATVVLAAWVWNWIYALMLAGLPLLGLLFPTGRVPGPRWRFLVPTTIGFACVAVLSSILMPGFIQIDVAANLRIVNPTGIDGFPGQAFASVGWIGIMAMLTAAVAAVVVRYRRSAGEERQQIRWLAYVAITATALVVIGVVLAIAIGESFCGTIAGQLLFGAGFALVGIGVPAAMGVAILKYRLYELDIVVKKTVVFGIVAVFITVLYLAVVVAIPTLALGAGADTGFDLVYLGAAILVAVAFNPIRTRARKVADRLVYGRRATPYEVLSEFADRLADVYSTDDVLPRMARLVAESVGATEARIWLRVSGELITAAAWPAAAPPTEPQRIRGEELPALPGHAVPVVHQTELLGAITLSMPASDPMSPAKDKLVRDVAGQAGLVLRNVRLIEELRASRQRLVTAQDEERRRLERNIHDGSQQQLVALQVKLGLAEQMADRDIATTKELLAQLRSETGVALDDLRDLARGIYPPLLADQGLAAALAAQTRKSPLPVTIRPDGVGRYPQEIEATIYFCVLEAMQNISKYSKATTVDIAVWERDDRLGFEVRDDGVGFDPASATRGTGLQGMADRLDAVGGELQISSVPGSGATVSGAISLSANAGRRPPGLVGVVEDSGG
jgi:signal transduction histidine kinase